MFINMFSPKAFGQSFQFPRLLSVIPSGQWGPNKCQFDANNGFGGNCVAPIATFTGPGLPIGPIRPGRVPAFPAQVGTCQSNFGPFCHKSLQIPFNLFKATLTAARHFVEMLGGQPTLELFAGNVSIRMSAVREGETAEPGALLDTDILPRELLETESAPDDDIFGIGSE
jgi:hypothetical protein